jgi:hypothetical protein
MAISILVGAVAEHFCHHLSFAIADDDLAFRPPAACRLPRQTTPSLL